MMTFSTGSKFKLERTVDNSLDKQKIEIKISESATLNFKAMSTDPNDSSIFYGDRRTDSTHNSNIINIRQFQDSTNYSAFYVGWEVPSGLIRWTGWWVDTDGKKGEFQLIYEKT
jgi:hypothetical protein